MVPPPASGSSNNEDSGDKTTVLEGDPETLRKELEKAKEQDACLIVIHGKPKGHRFFLTQSEMIIGRDPTADLCVPDQSISRKHARVCKQDGKVSIIDLNSSNGTFINDKKIPPGQPAFLVKEDMVKLGNSILKFLPAGELETLFYGSLGSAAHTDALTRIYNKGYLLEALDAEFKRAKALHHDFTLVFFDLDHFKKINDTFGHEAGDLVLKELANLIRSGYLRSRDVFARYGGEEFVILLYGMNAKTAADLSERIRSAVESHAFIYEGKRMPVTTSIGIAEMHSGMESPQTLLKAADKALYASKQNGRNRVTVST